jgi:hypothetical protein
MSRNRTTRRIALLLAIYLAIVWGAGTIAYRTGLAFATEHAGAPQPSPRPVPQITVAASQSEIETTADCASPCNAPETEHKVRHKTQRGSVEAAASEPAVKEPGPDSPLSIAMALTSETLDLSGGVFKGGYDQRQTNFGSIPGFVLAGIPSGGGGLPGIPIITIPPSSPPVFGPGDDGSGGGAPGGHNPPPGPPNPPGGGPGDGPEVLETPVPGAFYLFISAIAGFAFARRKATR